MMQTLSNLSYSFQLIHERDRLQDRLRALEEEVLIRAREERDFRVESSRKVRELETEIALAKASEEDAKKQLSLAKVR